MADNPVYARSSITLPPELLSQARKEARTRHMSLSGFMCMCLEEHMNPKPE